MSIFSLLSRKAIVILVAVFLLLSIGGFLHTTDRLPTTHLPWKPTSLPWKAAPVDCHSLRSNPHHVKAPAPADVTITRPLWQSLQDTFEEHRPAPDDVNLPAYKDGGHTKGQPGDTFPLSEDLAKYAREAHSQVLGKLPAYPTGLFSGRGVVILAGGRYSEYAATSLGMLREIGSSLPVEVWMKDTKEQLPGWCEELELEGMSCRRLTDYMSPAAFKNPYAMKVFTILYSSFQEVVFIDADSAPIRDPAPVFDSEIYKENGAILWPDYWKITGSRWMTYVVGLSDGQSEELFEEQSVESGQIFWDKKRKWEALLMATYYNYWGPDFFYTLFNDGMPGWGDKDAFPMSLRATHEPYYQVQHTIRTVFLTDSTWGIGMLQSSPLNESISEPMFLHSNMIKWSMRELMCKECEHKGYSSHYLLEDPESEAYPHLKMGKRIFGMGIVQDSGIDVEPMMWKSIEHTACRSVAWGSEQTCKQTRKYMQRTFGYVFANATHAPALGMDSDYCASDLIAAEAGGG